MAEFIERLIEARDSKTGWVQETASSMLSLKRRLKMVILQKQNTSQA